MDPAFFTEDSRRNEEKFAQVLQEVRAAEVYLSYLVEQSGGGDDGAVVAEEKSEDAAPDAVDSEGGADDDVGLFGGGGSTRPPPRRRRPRGGRPRTSPRSVPTWARRCSSPGRSTPRC